MNTEDKNYNDDRRRDERPVDINSVDSRINTSEAHHSSDAQSLTQDESANTDPNETDKASFEPTDKNANDRTRFDGDIKI